MFKETSCPALRLVVDSMYVINVVSKHMASIWLEYRPLIYF